MSKYNYERYYPFSKWKKSVSNYSFGKDMWGIHYSPTSLHRQKIASIIIERWVSKEISSILDIGGGVGFHTTALSTIANPNAKVILVDLSLRGLKLAQQAFSFQHVIGLNVLQGNAENLPINEKSIDFLICTEVLEHIESDAQALNEVFRVLKVGGIAYITVPLEIKANKGYGHLRTYTQKSLSEALTNTGFEIKQYLTSGLTIPIAWHTSKYFLYLFWLVISGNLTKQLKKSPIPSYYHSEFHQKHVLPFFSILYELDQQLAIRKKLSIGNTIHFVVFKPPNY